MHCSPRSRLVVSLLLLLSAVGVGLPQAALAAPAAGVTYTVNNNFDVVADFANDPGYTVCHTTPSNSLCTLRAAIMNANRYDGPATIILPPSTYTLSLSPTGPDDDASGDLNITGTVTIQGGGAATTIVDGATYESVFRTAPLAVVTLSGLTIRNGDITPSGSGGGVDNYGQLTLADSVVSGNQAGLGGGLYNESGATLRLLRSTIRDNVAVLNSGGGIESQGLLTIENSTVVSNRAVAGGGVSTRAPGSLTVVNSTISNNSVTGSGGGVFTASPTVFYHTTIAGNLADSDNTGGGYGGGVYASVAGYAHSWNSLFAYNYVTVTLNSCQGAGLTSDDYNFFDTVSGCAIAGTTTHNRIDLALLGPLADHGGGTETRANWQDSSAVDAIPANLCRDQFGAAPVPDQRGVARPVGGLCDMGAYEGAQALPFFFTNLVSNGDAEAAAGSRNGAPVGVPYWTYTLGQVTVVPYNAPGGYPTTPAEAPNPHGDNFFAGGATATTAASQGLNLVTLSALIDTGQVHYTFSADLGGFSTQSDSANAQLAFYNAGGGMIGSYVLLGPVTPELRGFATGFVHLSTSNPVPVGARSAAVFMVMSGSTGYNDGYADNLSLILTPPHGLFVPLITK